MTAFAMMQTMYKNVIGTEVTAATINALIGISFANTVNVWSALTLTQRVTPIVMTKATYLNATGTEETAATMKTLFGMHTVTAAFAWIPIKEVQ